MRIGKFSISKEIIDNNPNSVVDILFNLKIIPIRAETLYYSNAVEYIGLSPYFDDNPENMVIPIYVINTDIYKNGDSQSLRYSLEKING